MMRQMEWSIWLGGDHLHRFVFVYNVVAILHMKLTPTRQSGRDHSIPFRWWSKWNGLFSLEGTTCTGVWLYTCSYYSPYEINPYQTKWLRPCHTYQIMRQMEWSIWLGGVLMHRFVMSNIFKLLGKWCKHYPYEVVIIYASKIKIWYVRMYSAQHIMKSEYEKEWLQRKWTNNASLCSN